jgi:uncharacterized membrane protein HdeD (DUF308 family)
VLSPQHRRAFAYRAGALILTGAVITFTVEWHDTVVSELLFAASVLVTALAQMLSYRFGKKATKPPLHTLLQTLLALIVALVLIFTLGSFSVLSLTVLLWAAITAAIEVIAGWKSNDKIFGRELRISGLFAGVLAILLVVIPGSPVSVIGLYGGYSFVAGVYLAIASLDRPRRQTVES